MVWYGIYTALQILYLIMVCTVRKRKWKRQKMAKWGENQNSKNNNFKVSFYNIEK